MVLWLHAAKINVFVFHKGNTVAVHAVKYKLWWCTSHQGVLTARDVCTPMFQSGVNISIRWHGLFQNPATYVKRQIWHHEECICCTSDNISLSYSLVSSTCCWFCHFFSANSENGRFLRTPPWNHYEPVAPRTQHASTAALRRKPVHFRSFVGGTQSDILIMCQ